MPDVAPWLPDDPSEDWRTRQLDQVGISGVTELYQASLTVTVTGVLTSGSPADGGFDLGSSGFDLGSGGFDLGSGGRGPFGPNDVRAAGPGPNAMFTGSARGLDPPTLSDADWDARPTIVMDAVPAAPPPPYGWREPRAPRRRLSGRHALTVGGICVFAAAVTVAALVPLGIGGFVHGVASTLLPSSASPAVTAPIITDPTVAGSAAGSAAGSKALSGPTGVDAAAPGSLPAPTCSATYQVVQRWPGGFKAEVMVTAGPSPVGGWEVRWRSARHEKITQFWSAALVNTGPEVTAGNASFNGKIAGGADTTFGLIVTSPDDPGHPVPSCEAR